ncbi:putative glycerol kinase [Teladorsagia circumcincta]|uniref:Putative glycerol kinase n=1 Tax=Teladorsagia circumcincta TaxID=45464 RepID=A0A2G9UYK4_TELCI|nr:putative glycerol kinase [Teladorsagia circumcincta]
MVLLAAIDQGTSSSRFLVFEADTGDLVTSHQIEVRQLFPEPGWVEMDPNEIIETVKECIVKVVEKLERLGISPDEIKSIGIANQRGRLLFGTVDTWLIWKLTGQHVTDVSNASRTLLLDLHKRKWSSQLCNFFEIPANILPQIKSSAEVYGTITDGPLKGFPIAGCLGDQQAALFGPDSPVVYALEGSGSIGGNVVRFLRDNFNFIKDASEMEKICRSVETTEGVIFVPCFTGLYTPYWDPTARGTILGLTQVTNRAHICLAALRAVAYQSAEMIKAVEEDLGDSDLVHTLKTDGGMTANMLFNEIQAEIIGKVIKTPKITEISGWGAAVAGGIGAQQISIDDFSARDPLATTYMPHSDENRRAADLERWKDAVNRARGWAQSAK